MFVQYCRNEKQGLFSIVKEYQKGDVIGEVNFFNGQAMNISVRSQDFTTVLKIDRDVFMEIVKNNQRDYQKFYEIKDKILLYTDLKPLNLQCTICNSFNHLSGDCPLSHFRIDNPLLFDRFNKSSDQERDANFKRKEIIQFDAYLDMYHICNSVNRIIDQIQFDSQNDQIYSSLSNMTDELQDEVNDEDDEQHTEKQTFSRHKSGSQIGVIPAPNSSQLSVIPPPQPEQQAPLYNYKNRRTSRDHSFLFQQEKTFIQNQLSLHNNPLPSYQQFDSYQVINSNNNSTSNEPYSGLTINVEKPTSGQIYSGQQIYSRFDENYNKEPSSTSLKENPQTQPIFLRRRPEQALITQLKNFLKDPTQYTIREESIRSHSQSKNNKQVQKAAVIPVENQFIQQQQIEKIKQQNVYWYFDQQKDYLYYFPEGNMFQSIQKYNNMKKKIRDRALSTKGESLSPLKKSKTRKSIKIKF